MTFFFSEKKESGEEEAGLEPKMPTTSRVIAGKLSHRIAPLQLLTAPATPPLPTPKERTAPMSWDDQVAAEESRNSASRTPTIPQTVSSTDLISHGPNYGTAEPLAQRNNNSARPGPCDVTGDCDCLVTHDSDSLP